MADQIKQNNINHKLEALPEIEFGEVVNYISHLETSRSDKASVTDDDLIMALQNQRENRRARQVFEWENVRRESPNYGFWRGAL